MVLCQYNLVAKHGVENERVDVRFGPEVIVWGAPASAFEEVTEASQLELVGA